MRRCIAILIGLSLLPHSSYVLALSADDIVAIPPVSTHYVQRVLDRADAGIARANSLTTPGGLLYNMSKPWWILYATSAMLSTVDTRFQVSEAQKDLLETTPCLHLDVIILQSKIEMVRRELHDALKNDQPNRIILLQRLIRFLNRRIIHLLRGARDPLYEDSDWADAQWFDPVNPVWCCPQGIPGNTCTLGEESLCTNDGGLAFTTPRACQEYGCLLPPSQQPLDGKLCPFTSDYLPPVTSGYGCDTTAFPAAASGHTPSVKEMTALADLIIKRDAFITRMQSFAPLIQSINAMAGVSPPSSNLGGGLTRTHKEVHGCLEQIPLARQIGPTSLLQEIHAGQAEKRGPFSIPKDEPWIAVRFAGVVQRWGARRPQAKALRYPSEFPPGPDRIAAENRENKKTPIERAKDWYLRNFFLSWNVTQSKKEPVPIAKSQDNALQIALASPNLTPAITRLGALVRTHNAGLRFFGKGFAYYLRRSCIFRPCNKKLEQVLKILFENACFPYFNGTYFGNAQIHKRCKDDADIGSSSAGAMP